MSALVDKARAMREPAFKTIRKFYGQQTKVKLRHVIATRKIAWSESDLSRCRETGITVITDPEIEYYASLVRHLKHAARYQFLAHMFEGQRIDGLAKQVVATRGKMGGDTFYTFLMRPNDLLKIAYVGHKASRDVENIETYQRLLQPRRLKKIGEYINGGGKFPTNIVGRVAPGDCSPEALTRSGQGDFHHPAPPLMCLVATPPISARQPAGGEAGSVPTIG